PVTVRVVDNGSPSLSDTRTFSVTVNEVNTAPILAAIPDQVVYAGTTLSFTNQAVDADIPANMLTFSLGSGAPTGAGVNPTNGVFTWTPSVADASTTNLINVRVTDDGLPSFTDSLTFAVVVVPAPVIESVSVSGSNIVVVWSAVAGRSYRVQYKTDLNNSVW